MGDDKGQAPDRSPDRKPDHVPKFVPDTRPVAGRDRKGEPPPWAIVVMIVVIGFVVLMFSNPGIAYAIVPFAHSDYFWIGLIALPFVSLIALAVASKLVDLRRAQSWTTAAGKIVRSDLIQKRHRFQGEEETVENAPAVEYEFSVGARKYRGSRIGIGDDSGGAESEATLARYPKGASVTVFYDPNDPRNCVLERGGPFRAAANASAPADAATAAAPAAAPKPTATGCAIALAEVALIGGAIWWVIARGPDYIAAHFPKAEPGVTIFAACFGLAALLMFLAAHHRSKLAQKWPKVTGKVVKSAVESYWDHVGGAHGSATKFYRPVVEFSYQVRGRNYRSNQIKLDMKVSGSRTYADKVAAKYPEGAEVDVHYDPDNPGTAALENPTGATWIIAAVAAFAFAIAVYTLGIFR